jgi:hypothetical protein
MLGFSDIKKNFSEAWTDLSFPGDFFSVGPFKSVCQGIIVLGSYAVAAVVIPFIIDFFIVPIAITVAALAVLSFAAGLYHKFLDDTRNEAKTKNCFIASSLLSAIALLLDFSGLALGIALAALSIYRIYKSVGEAYHDSPQANSIKY